jgi:hypothetical protein
MDLDKESGEPEGVWENIYKVITACNYLTGIDPTTITGDQDDIKHSIGQAFALRAMAHYDLLRYFGQQHVTGGTLGIPYITQLFTVSLNKYPARNTIAECETFIMADLEQAIALMSDSQNGSSYMSTNAANALAARIALYFGDWATAKAKAWEVINSGDYSIIEADQFAASWAIDNSENSIFELSFNGTDNEGSNGLAQIYRGPSYGDAEALPSIVDIFDVNDVRGGSDMIDYDPHPDFTSNFRNLGKYPTETNSDNVFLIRYEEVILIYAEACFEINNADPDALGYLNMIPEERNADAYIEAFAFDDLARTHLDIPLVDPDRQTHGGPAYGSYKYAFPIPIVEMNANSNMVQNAGY